MFIIIKQKESIMPVHYYKCNRPILHKSLRQWGKPFTNSQYISLCCVNKYLFSVCFQCEMSIFHFFPFPFQYSSPNSISKSIHYFTLCPMTVREYGVAMATDEHVILYSTLNKELLFVNLFVKTLCVHLYQTYQRSSIN